MLWNPFGTFRCCFPVYDRLVNDDPCFIIRYDAEEGESHVFKDMYNINDIYMICYTDSSSPAMLVPERSFCMRAIIRAAS